MTNLKEPTRVFDFLTQYFIPNNFDDAFCNKINGEWVKHSAKEIVEKIDLMSHGLYALGIRKDDKVAIISTSRPEWNITDFGIQQLGAISVPMYPTITVEDYRYIFNDAGVKIVFVSDQKLYDKVIDSISTLSVKPTVYSFDQLKGIANFQEVLQLGKSGDQAKLEEMKAAVNPDDLLTLIYTSGTTGFPKGVMLSHSNIVSNVMACVEYFVVEGKDKVLSFLPLCHIYERAAIYIYIRMGARIYYAESMETIADNIREVKPAMFTTVPRLLEKVYDKIVAKGYELTGLKKTLFFWALNLGLRFDPTKEMGFFYDLQLKIARKLIFVKWREALGGNLKVITSGSAALQPRLSRIFWAAGIPVSEGYGLTETSPVISTSRVQPIDFRVGCVGTVLSNVEVKIADDGEILCKGPNVMKGYYNKPEATAEAIDSEGWFHTGDIGTLIEGKYLKITDRKKEIFKTSGGKYVAPQQIENKLKESIYIEQCMVVGENQKFPSALIVPDFAALKEWCATHEIPYTNDTEIIKNQLVRVHFDKEVEQLMVEVAQWERVKKIALLPRLFTIDDGELTAKLSLKRKAITEKNKALIEALYL
ncbi:MAG: AMP-dependent synthetase/ligase [Bacteroidota bacterium]